MKRTAIGLLCLSCGLATTAAAQRAVPISGEPHHHLVYTGDGLRVYRVVVPAHAATLLHDHPVDYFWIAVGASQFVNAVSGKADSPVTAPDGSVHFSRGGFAHIARIDGAQAFHNVTIEMTDQQTNPHNLCAAVLPDQPLDCAAAMARAATLYSGATILPEFETDQLRVSLITLAPRAVLTLARHRHAPLLVAVDDATGSLPITCPVTDDPKGFSMQSRSGNTYRLRGTARCTVHNQTRTTVRFLAIEFPPPAH